MRTETPRALPIVPIASATVIQGSHSAAPFVVEELSPTRAILRGPAFGAISLGKATVVLSFPGMTEMLRLEGVVSLAEWCDEHCIGVTLNFSGLQPDVEDQIQEIVTKHVERTHLPMVVVLDAGRTVSAGLRRSIHLLGRECVIVQNSLDALWFMERFRDNYGTILVDYSFVQENGPEILPFLHDRYPDKRRLLVVPRFESTAGDLSTLTWSVHGVLTSPWTLQELQSALGLSPADSARQPKRILFVDDESYVLAGLQRRLNKYLRGLEAVWVTSGEVALAESQARPFDVVVTDLRMPGMDGLALLQSIRRLTPQTKRVILSGQDTHAVKGVADVVLSKPCSLDLLRMEVIGPT